jgi:hypothetical protein
MMQSPRARSPVFGLQPPGQQQAVKLQQVYSLQQHYEQASDKAGSLRQALKAARKVLDHRDRQLQAAYKALDHMSSKRQDLESALAQQQELSQALETRLRAGLAPAGVRCKLKRQEATILALTAELETSRAAMIVSDEMAARYEGELKLLRNALQVRAADFCQNGQDIVSSCLIAVVTQVCFALLVHCSSQGIMQCYYLPCAWRLCIGLSLLVLAACDSHGTSPGCPAK